MSMPLSATGFFFSPGSPVKSVHGSKHGYMTRYCENSLQRGRLRQQIVSWRGTDYSNHEEGKEEVSKAILIWRAIKLPIYSVALVPLTVGSAAAYLQTGMFLSRRYFELLVSSFFIITWLNISNDVYDFDMGADKNKKESVVNLVGNRSVAAIAAYLSLFIGVFGLSWVSADVGDPRSLLLLACAFMCGYLYQCPPFRLSYQGLGEPLCFASFGPFATTAFYLLQGSTSDMTSPPVTATVLSASFLIGLTTSLILFCSHFHQIEGDTAVGKMSPLVRKAPKPLVFMIFLHWKKQLSIYYYFTFLNYMQVRLGTKKGSKIVNAAVMTLYTFLFASGLSGALPFTCLVLCALTLPIGNLVFKYVEENHQDKERIFMAKYYSVRLHVVFAAALAAGLVSARLLPKNYVPRIIFS